LGYFLGWGIVMSKQSVYMTTSIILAVIVNILLNVILIPDYGIMGSAIATLAAILAWNGQKIYYTNKLYPLHFEYGKLLIITISTLAAFGISVLVRFDSMFTTIFFKVLLLVLFFIFQIATGIFSLRNLSFIRQIRSH
ncbi:MAG: polysaccharide biosynthesis C-terminal domain-containing protein, partial [Desulfatibacillaceae bacterium]